jgi:hypothetical protein
VKTGSIIGGFINQSIKQIINQNTMKKMKTLKTVFFAALALLFFLGGAAAINQSSGGPADGAVFAAATTTTTDPVEVNVEIVNPLKANTLEEVINSIINFVFWLAVVICPLVIILGGFIFVTAGGDPKKVENGKKIIYYALIGLGVVIMAKGFVAALIKILGVKK